MCGQPARFLAAWLLARLPAPPYVPAWLATLAFFPAGAFLLAALTSSPAGAQDLLAAPERAWILRSSVALAYDSFGQRYTVADDDTLDLIDELSGRWILGLEHRGNAWFELANSLGIGQEATRNDTHLGLRWRARTLDVQILDDLHTKAWRELSQYTLSSDYLTNTARLLVTVWPVGPWRLRGTGRLENAHFMQRSRYNYDYWRHDLGAEVERRWGVFSELRGGYSYGRREVPDSTAIDYRAHRITAGWTQEFGAHTLTLDQWVERRRYRDTGTRSPYLDYEADLTLSAALGMSTRLRPAYRALVTNYDLPDSIYTDATEQSVEILLERELTPNTTLGVGPRGEFRRTGSLFDRPYDQWGLKGTLSYLPGPSLWVQFSNEIGVRTHRAGSEVLFTDYLFNWSTLMLSWHFPPRLNLDLFFSLEPEDHADDRDDTTTLLVSTALTFGLY